MNRIKEWLAMARSHAVGALLTAVVFTGGSARCQAQFALSPYTVYAGGGTRQGTTNAFAVVSANSVNGGTPLVNYLNVVSDAPGSVLQFWTITNLVDCMGGSNTTLYFTLNGSTGAANTNLVTTPGQVFCLRHVATDTYEYLISAGITGQAFTTNYWTQIANHMVVTNTTVASMGSLTLQYAPMNPVQAGDRLYLVSPAGSIPVGNSNLSLAAPGVYAGQRGLPLMMSITGYTNENINAISATYQ